MPSDGILLGQAEYLRIPRLRGGLGLESIRIVYPVERIAFGLRASDDKLPAEVRSEVMCPGLRP